MFFYDYADRCVASSCSVSYWSAVTEYSGPVPVMTTTLTVPDLTLIVTNDSFLVEYGTPITTTVSYNGSVLDVVERQDPCCGGCSIWANEFEFFYWPDQATPLPRASQDGRQDASVPMSDTVYSYIDEGFTFISPSVYLAFSSLRARDSCGTVGQDVIATTMAFDADEMSTLSASTWVLTTCGWPGMAVTSTVISRQITFADLEGNCTTPSAPWLEWHPDDLYAYMNTLGESSVKIRSGWKDTNRSEQIRAVHSMQLHHIMK
ncbi:hypothetical protein EK21DRAFT_117739 [Setomelanomma holmii]|uniref:Uncharacterized protein n=1 Tax=Setomelanomma holmii TaxID=210430 RepID=A0A9P4LGR4_9PLEO|nr:hypothetical protein EK21DRAFT_117739 [Setomelanomma holmii]